MGSTVQIGSNACNALSSCGKLAGSGGASVPYDKCNSGWHPCEGCSGTCGASDDSTITKNLVPSADVHLRGTENIDESNNKNSHELEGAGCFPYAQKVKLQQDGIIEPKEGIELLVASSGVNVAEGQAVLSSHVVSTAAAGRKLDYDSVDVDITTWEVDLEHSFLVNSVSVLSTWCNESTDTEKCLCNLSGASLSLIDGNGEEITSVLVGDTCGQKIVEFTFDASPEFCKPAAVSLDMFVCV
jgi:hypothetical protein